ncbi:MAG TPA: CRISPR system precrRNA processing endoribonuclease RAMP protein Cas6 [Bryobacteraceae bacterium]|nr:CRISPR system precrRNA processing endoribonuclease RAMP protein Cas6 [Bryobacteraceae bacterium]
MTLSCIPLRFFLRARSSIYFPEGKPGNVLRGALGLAFRAIACAPECIDTKSCPQGRSCAYARIFEPSPAAGAPSGFADPPRPFVFRARQLSGAVLEPGTLFHFDVHLFDTQPATTTYFIAAFRDIAASGFGPRRGQAELERVSLLDCEHRPVADLYDPGAGARVAGELEEVALSLAPDVEAGRIRIEFLTPTELRKEETVCEPPAFGFLFARLRDRVSNLRALYGAGPLPLEFAALGQRAREVTLAGGAVRPVDTLRTSRRTGQTHPIGGIVGVAEYEGALGEFLPYLRAAAWTGVGRHAVWGNGELRVSWS